MIIINIYDGKMANCCQTVRGNKTNKTKMTTKKQTKQNKNNDNKKGAGGMVEKANN